jgi:hypothetical protein
MLSVELMSPEGPTLPLSPDGKPPALEAGVPDPRVIAARERETDLETKSKDARKLIAAGDFDAAEALLISRDAGPEVCARMGLLYEERLRKSSEQEARVRESLYRRALDWKLRSYPEPHTEMEAQSYWRGMAEDRSRLAELLGYDPDAPR